MTGKVYLVGAGPGDPGLLTLKGAECLRVAQVVVVDHLVDARTVSAHASPDAEIITRPAKRAELDQEEITRLLIDRALKGKTVVRLKGGDPFVFGRGGEEAQALAAAGVPFEIVPGVPAAVAVPAYAGISITHRGAAASVAIATGHEADLKDGGQVAWDALSKGASTLVLYMSVTRLADTVARLRAAGRPATEPIALIERGTTSRQRTLVSTLGEVVAAARDMDIQPPALTVVGEVVRKGRTAWFDNRPLHGRRLLVLATREIANGFRPDGLEVTSLSPLKVELRLAEAEAALGELARMRAIVFASAHAAQAFAKALEARGLDARALAHCKIATVGAVTARELPWIRPDLVGRQTGAELAREILAARWAGPVLVLGAASGRRELADALVAGGLEVVRGEFYETRDDREALARLRDERWDAIAFASPKGVKAFVSALGKSALESARIFAIGETTRDELAAHGVSATVATRPELGQLVDEIAAALAKVR